MRGSKAGFKTKIEPINGDVVHIDYSGEKQGDVIEFEILESAITRARAYKQKKVI